MKCETLPHPTYPRAFAILLDGQPHAKVHASIVGKRFKAPDEFVNQTELFTWLNEHLTTNSRRYVLWRLSKAPMSVSKLRQMLKEKWIPEEISEELIANFIRLGILNDEAYAQQLMRRKKRSLCGSKAIHLACLQQGLDPTLATSAYAQSTTIEEEQAAILTFARKKGHPASTPKEKQKIIAALMRRGFSYGAIKDALQSNYQTDS